MKNSHLTQWVVYVLSFAAGLGLAWGSWFLWVEPNYPYLLLDKNAPVVDDQTGIGYLPIEMTGADENGAIVKRMCVVPNVYKKYAHGVKSDGIFAPDGWLEKNIVWVSWIVVAIALSTLGVAYMIKQNRLRRKVK